MASTSRMYQITIKEEPLSDMEMEVSCRLCNKTFASLIALNNHARVVHVEAYQNGDESVWVAEDGVQVKQEIQDELDANDPEVVLQRTNNILAAMKPSFLTNLASNNVSYIILKNTDSSKKPVAKPITPNKNKIVEVKKKKVIVEKKLVKKEKPTQVITGPFECLEPSNLGSDGSCHRIFFSCCEYSSHIKNDHSKRRRVMRCQVCEKPLAVNMGDDKFYCETCAEGFDTIEQLQDHMTTAHVKVKKYECTICSKRFTQKGGVQQHMRMHTGDRPYPCTFCPKQFTQKSGLDQHLRIHTKVKPYHCIVCSKNFCQSIHLKQHMRTHTNVAPFQCGLCNKRFKQSSHLNHHLKNHNPGNLSEELKAKYQELVGQLKKNEVNTQSEIEEQLLAEQSIQEDGEQSIQEDGSYDVNEPYVIVENNEELLEF